MKKKILILIVGICIITALAGCGKISDGNITIKKYKGLKVEAEKDSDNAEDELEEKVWKALLEQCDVKKYPQDKIEFYTEEIVNQYDFYSTMYDVKVEELIKQDYGATLEQVVKDKVCRELATELIAEKEKLKISEQEYKEGLTKLALEYQFDDTKEFEKFVGKENIKQTMLQEKVTEFLVKNCKQ